jgi:transposase InsO family protein
MVKEVKEWIRSCPECQQRKNPVGQPQRVHPNLLATHPWQVIAVDITGPFPDTKHKYRYVLVIIDVFTKFVEAVPLRSISTKSIANAIITRIICRYGAPRALLSDLGSNFISRLAMAIYQLLDIKKLNTSGYHPQTNGLVERFNSTLKAMIRMYTNLEFTDWDDFLPYCVFAYNTSIQETTKYSPYYLLFGRAANLPIDVMSRTDDEIYTNEDEFIQKRILHMRYAHKFAEDAHRRIHIKYLKKLESKPYDKFKEGDKVYCRIYSPKFGIPLKKALLWHGPFIITEAKPNGVNYIIKKASARTSKELLVHVKNLRPFYVVESDLRSYPGLHENPIL